MLLALSGQLAGVVDHLFDVTSRKYAVTISLVVFLDIEVNRTVLNICEAGVENLLNHCNLLDDMTRGMRLDRRTQHIELVHRLMVSDSVILCNFHRLEVFQTGFLCNLILAFVGIVLKVTHVGNVAHIAHLVTEMFQITENQVKSYSRTCMTEVSVTVNGRSANIHAHMTFMHGFEGFLHASQAIVNI